MVLAMYSHGDIVGKQVALIERIVIVDTVVQAGVNYTIVTATSLFGPQTCTLDNSLYSLRNNDGG